MTENRDRSDRPEQAAKETVRPKAATRTGPPRPRSSAKAGYPQRDELPGRGAADGGIDRSRRRFLAQIGCGAGGIGVLAAAGLPRLAHGQSREVDFSVLEAHPPTATAEPVPTPAPAPPAAPAAAAPPAPAEPAPAQIALPTDTADLLVENRALWVEPGFLLLVRWERAPDDNAVIAAFEGSTSVLSDYLESHVSEMDDLHNIDRLHAHELELAELLRAQVEPAKVQVLHLDHDCTTVCSARGWTFPDTDPIPLPGVPPAPHYP